ncbi:MAG: hypothetical protein COY72_00110 [Candidatus Nealsonbacteria bacterium CG_4_10_14_0_8_um_filter_35_10]|uniref:Uncharacterized protein n=2 Tax=Candidatus Nealsoniibacteriota TaxID=1817911 RepID=A0A2M7R8R4_9BACT|nr:MAG: hypothetical protein AUJ24_01655 [Parcubacteria group bacterium CG1_02_36_42]PIY91065.1 MAG: hypothetical protein COY72_00110 [Candidatus Nealsonbacteria bacterium CG_4_10_14_0_8_um_filter_35_10]PJB99678.1 MAG: hypothetical protein CO077_00425 [Candidatus Nealsonbacteria bacterium CG_4_9_14_0_8_um_filter_35_12]
MELGIIQEIEIHNEGQDLETIWFAQKSGPIRNVSYKALKKRDFKVSDVLIKAGFKISEPQKFDSELKELLAPKLLR